MPLDGLVSDLDKYLDLAPYRKNGELLALPQAGGAQAMAINLDIMDEIGYVIPDSWTIDDFLKMAEMVKAKYNGKKWATGMFAANQSGDYLLNQWFASFGVSFYGPAGYDVSTIADTGGAKVYEFFKLLDAKGYIPPNSASLTDDDYAASWGDGNIAATAFFPSWMKPYWDTAIKQGNIDKPFRVKYVPFPAAPGVKKVPVYFSNAAVLAVKTGTEIDKAAAYFIEVWNGQWAQTHILKTGVMSTRSDVTPNQDVYLLQVSGVVARHGIQDVGLTDSRFTERRAQQFPILQRMLNGKVSPADAIKEYQAKLTSVK
jgi:ABC-type glycerol-3-phosphate transport system substrate-binding protein